MHNTCKHSQSEPYMPTRASRKNDAPGISQVPSHRSWGWRRRQYGVRFRAFAYSQERDMRPFDYALSISSQLHSPHYMPALRADIYLVGGRQHNMRSIFHFLARGGVAADSVGQSVARKGDRAASARVASCWFSAQKRLWFHAITIIMQYRIYQSGKSSRASWLVDLSRTISLWAHWHGHRPRRLPHIRAFSLYSIKTPPYFRHGRYNAGPRANLQQFMRRL